MIDFVLKLCNIHKQYIVIFADKRTRCDEPSREIVRRTRMRSRASTPDHARDDHPSVFGADLMRVRDAGVQYVAE